MKLQLDHKEVISLTRVIFYELQTMKEVGAETSDDYLTTLSVFKVLLNAYEVTIDDNLPF